MTTESAILRAASLVTDPLTGRDLVASGRVKAVSTDPVRLTLDIPREAAERYAPIAEQLKQNLARAGARDPQVLLTAHRAGPDVKAPPKRGQPHKPRRPEGYQGDSRIKTVIAVSSAKGGVGKSTIAYQLAHALTRRGLAVGLLDADIHGPSLPLLSDLKGTLAPTVEVEGRTLIKPLEKDGLRLLSIGFLTKDDGPIVWRGPMVQGAMTRMLWDAHWDSLDILLIDMPPGTGDAQLGLAQDIRPKGALIVTTPQDLALEDARKGEEMFAKVDIPVLGHILNMAHFTCPHCGKDTDIFGATDMEALVEIPLSLAVREGTDTEPFDTLAAKLMERLT